MTKRRLSLVALGVMAVAAPLAAAAPASAAPAAPISASCADAASIVVEDAGVTANGDGLNFTCGPSDVSVTGTTTAGSPIKLAAPRTAPAAKESFATTAVDETNCIADGSTDTRTIVSELEVNMNFCLAYGQLNSPENGDWTRTVSVDWTSYPGWPSAQNRVTTVPAAGAPVLSGFIIPRKQNWPTGPNDLNGGVGFTNYGNSTTTGWNVGGFTAGGSHSIQMENMSISDATYGFSAPVDNAIVTPRFNCDSELQRCAYEGGLEAGL
jgi:hypothetical protein